MGTRKSAMDGFTLLEVLASIVILSIILISFFSFFPQMELFNNNTKDNLDSVAIAKELLIEMKPLKYIEIADHPTSITLPTDPPTEWKIAESSPEFLILRGNYREKFITITINRKEEVYKSSEGLNKHEMKIEVFESDEKSQPSSTIYGYIQH